MATEIEIDMDGFVEIDLNVNYLILNQDAKHIPLGIFCMFKLKN